MKEISVVAIDIAKDIFQLQLEDKERKNIRKKTVYRSEMHKFFGNLTPCTVAMEACAGSHYWARELEGLGHKVVLIAGEFVKSYVHGHKNNVIDAAAIAEALKSPRLHPVGINTIEIQDLQMKHRIRERLVRNRTALGNEIYGFLHEYGIVIPKSLSKITVNSEEALEKAGDKVTGETKRAIRSLLDEMRELTERIALITKELESVAKSHPVASRLKTIPGIGPITATALITIAPDPTVFKNGRHFAAFLGLVPLQRSTGKHHQLGRITKRGNPYIRCLLVQGAQVCVNQSKRPSVKPSLRNQWIKDLNARRGRQKTVVALANKTARIAWAIMSDETKVYDPCFQRLAS